MINSSGVGIAHVHSLSGTDGLGEFSIDIVAYSFDVVLLMGQYVFHLRNKSSYLYSMHGSGSSECGQPVIAFWVRESTLLVARSRRDCPGISSTGFPSLAYARLRRLDLLRSLPSLPQCRAPRRRQSLGPDFPALVCPRQKAWLPIARPLAELGI